jgi:hypothetical protein
VSVAFDGPYNEGRALEEFMRTFSIDVRSASDRDEANTKQSYICPFRVEVEVTTEPPSENEGYFAVK